MAAVTNPGGLGVMGDNFANLDDLDVGIKELRSLVGDRPFGADFLRAASALLVTFSTP